MGGGFDPSGAERRSREPHPEGVYRTERVDGRHRVEGDQRRSPLISTGGFSVSRNCPCAGVPGAFTRPPSCDILCLHSRPPAPRVARGGGAPEESPLVSFARSLALPRLSRLPALSGWPSRGGPSHVLRSVAGSAPPSPGAQSEGRVWGAMRRVSVEPLRRCGIADRRVLVSLGVVPGWAVRVRRAS